MRAFFVERYVEKNADISWRHAADLRGHGAHEPRRLQYVYATAAAGRRLADCRRDGGASADGRRHGSPHGCPTHADARALDVSGR